MTNVIANIYALAIRANAESVKENNKKKADSLVLRVSDKACFAMLNKNKIDAQRFETRAFYATEKCVKIVYNVTRDVIDMSDVNDNAFAAIKTLIVAKAAKHNVTKDMLCATLTSDFKLDEKLAAFVYRRKALLSAATLNAQSQQVIDMIKTLKLVKEVANNVFEVQDTVLMQAFESKFAALSL